MMRPIDATLIKVPLETRSKAEAIGELLDLMVAQGLVRDRERLLADLLRGADGAPVALTEDTAVPHVRSDYVDEPVCAFGNTLNGAIDLGPANPGGPSRSASMLFLMISPARETGPYVKGLAKIARLVRDAGRCNQLKSASEPTQVLELLGELARA